MSDWFIKVLLQRWLCTNTPPSGHKLHNINKNTVAYSYIENIFIQLKNAHTCIPCMAKLLGVQMVLNNYNNNKQNRLRSTN